MDFTISLPDWAIEENERLPAFMPSLEERMAAVIRFSQLNIEKRTGGPFAAGVFELKTGKRIIVGVNRVVQSSCSSAHAEVVTLSLAQKIFGAYDLGGPTMPTLQIVVNWCPCAMCCGAVVWSGVRSLAIAGSGPELEQITGFDEGPIHPEWKKEFAKRGIDVIDGVLTEQAVAVFRTFKASGALVYNGRQGS